jgi:NAD-dependent DNA ligase
MLVLGRHREKITVAQLRNKRMNPLLKSVIKRAIGPRSKRYADAWEMLLALRGEPMPATSPLETLNGKTIVFSGTLSMRRADAEALATKAGARVVRRVTRAVDVVVRGKPARGGVGKRPTVLIDAQRLVRQGRHIEMIDELELLRLARASR